MRKYFGSTKNLLDIFIKLPIYPVGISGSWADIKRNIRIPTEMTAELAEETGIHIGDGNLHISTDKNGFNSYNYSINGDLINEYLYHVNHINKIMKDLYNLEGSFLARVEKNNIDSRYKSKSIVEFKNKILKLPIGTKKNIKIPNSILKNKEFQKNCIVGIIDTDFTITSSLSISGKINNLFVAKEMHKIFNKEGINHVYRRYDKYSRFYIQKDSALKIIKDWPLNNIKHISKLNIFEEFGKYIPHSTTPERLALLAGKIDINELEEITRKRLGINKVSSTYPYNYNL